MEIVEVLIGLGFGALVYVVTTFLHKRKEERLLDELSEQRRKNFDLEIQAITNDISDSPLEELLDHDERIIKD